jgi:hypothetical protein
MEKSENVKKKIKKREQISPLKSEKKYKTVENHIPDSFPKNVNEFRHIIDDIKCGRADVEFMLELRRHKKRDNNLDKVHTNEPSFYQNDLSKYKNKNILKPEEKKMLQVNIGQYKYILSDRTKYAINDSTFKYEVRLRTEPPSLSKSVDIKYSENNKNSDNVQNKKSSFINIKKWDNTNIPKHVNLFNSLLPPILPQSKEIFAKNENRIGRPIIVRRKDAYINGIKIKSRIFDYNSVIALRYPSEHFPNSRYFNDYGVGNLGEISHLLKDDNRTMSNNWYSFLRGIKKKSISPEEIKKTEQKLRDKSNQKSNLKI